MSKKTKKVSCQFHLVIASTGHIELLSACVGASWDAESRLSFKIVLSFESTEIFLIQQSATWDSNLVVKAGHITFNDLLCSLSLSCFRSNTSQPSTVYNNRGKKEETKMSVILDVKMKIQRPSKTKE